MVLLLGRALYGRVVPASIAVLLCNGETEKFLLGGGSHSKKFRLRVRRAQTTGGGRSIYADDDILVPSRLQVRARARAANLAAASTPRVRVAAKRPRPRPKLLIPDLSLTLKREETSQGPRSSVSGLQLTDTSEQRVRVAGDIGGISRSQPRRRRDPFLDFLAHCCKNAFRGRTQNWSKRGRTTPTKKKKPQIIAYPERRRRSRAAKKRATAARISGRRRRPPSARRASRPS